MSARKRNVIDLEIERARRAFDGPELYPGELIETVIVGLIGDVQRIDPSTPSALVELVSGCDRIKSYAAARLRIGFS